MTEKVRIWRGVKALHYADGCGRPSEPPVNETSAEELAELMRQPSLSAEEYAEMIRKLEIVVDRMPPEHQREGREQIALNERNAG